jgi:transcriptional regulator with XRE-family HTH domain
MRLPAPPETLRVARSLTALTQQKVAELAGVTRRYISNAETSQSMFELNLQLVDFYVAQGIEFLGQASIGNKTSHAGARWLAPESPALLGKASDRFHVEKLGISFRAARALLNKTQNEIVAETGLSIAAVKGLETGNDWLDSSKTLQDYYEGNRVEFLGWSDARSRLFYGVGVRWID